jgi:protein ImuB
MPVAKARALAPGLAVREADPRADAEGLERLALWAMERLAPIVAVDPPDGLVLDTTGADHLHGGEAAMLTSIVQRFAAAGANARAAIADSWGAAHAAARHLPGATTVVPAGQHATMLRSLPIAALRLEPGIVRDLRILGFVRIGDLMDQPRAPLALRFGPEIGRRLDQALGLVAQPIEPIRSPKLVEVRRIFGEPIAAPETIARYTGKLVAALCAELETRGLGARRLDLLFHRVDNTRQAIRIGTAQPVRDAKRLTRLLTEKIETVEPGFGIELMALAAIAAEPLREKQVVSSLVDEPEPDLRGLIDVLANRVGEDRICRFVPVRSDVPERSVVRGPSLSPTSLVNFERNCYSVPASFANRPVSLRIYPERIVVAAEGQILCEHPRIIDRSHHQPGCTAYDWRHYLAVIQRKPGAPRNGAPFTELPEAFRQLQSQLLNRPGGDREMAEILALVLHHDEQAVLCAVELAIEAGVATKTHVLNLLHRPTDGKTPPASPIDAPLRARARRRRLSAPHARQLRRGNQGIGRRENESRSFQMGVARSGGGGLFSAGDAEGSRGHLRARGQSRHNRGAARGGPDRGRTAEPEARRALYLCDDTRVPGTIQLRELS